ncbi:MAG: hypothetical protein PHR77_10935 [Kiritimatiellae bacterium]|nr:hypothetical protein [Kiritimatiellia bacterium]MDD5520330.1 hypothetical protein [Kiritimatiellia bacterium]
MKRKNSSYDPQLVNFPSVIIGVAWVMLWFLWPHGGQVTLKKQISVPPRVSFVKSSDSLYSRPSSFQTWKTIAETGDAVVAVPWLSTRPAKLLEKNPFTIDEPSVNKAIFSDAIFNDMKTYRPAWDDPAVYQYKTDDRMCLVIQPADALKESGFQVPDFSAELKKTDKPWSVTVFVEVGNKGKVENVFLETGCENREINSMVVKSMYRGNLQKTGTRTEGRVMVNFGRD